MAGVRRAAAALLLLLAGCGRDQPAADTPGARLEAAAIARGIVADPESGTLIGSWATDTDRLCIVPAERKQRIGASVDYGEGQACAASGTVERSGQTLHIDFGACRFDAGFDGTRIVFPAELPGACSRLCIGRASLAALAVERLSQSASEAATLRGANGRLLCAD